MFRKSVGFISSMAVVLSGLTLTAAPTQAAMASAAVSPSYAEPGVATQFTVTITTDGTATSGIQVSPEWDWPVSYGSRTTDTIASRDSTTITCSNSGIVFTAVGGTWTTPATRCDYVDGGADDPANHLVRLIGAVASASTTSITVVFPSGVVTPLQSARGYGIWTALTTGSSAIQVRVSTRLAGEVVEPPPTIRLEINGNGGVCTPSFVEGEQGTWGTAPTADKCTNGSRQLAFFSTSPTAAIGATNVRPGGPVFFFTANLLYAIWAPDKPSPVNDVVATPGLNSVKVTWKAPVSDGGAPINSYCIALRTEQNPNPFPRCLNAAQPLEFTFSLPATNSKYTPTVFARNSAGSSELVAGAPASPYDIKGVIASRKDLLLGLGGTQVEARGDAPGLAGQSLNVEYKVGAGQWTTQANAVSVDAKSNFRWSKKFPRSSNKNAVTVRFSYGTDAVVGPFVLTRGGEAGDLSAPRNIKVDNRPNKINVTWDRPKFDGGATITGYTLCATPGDGIGGRICRSETGTEGTFWNLNTRQTYTFTVSAKTTTREGPRGKYSKPVDPTDASIRSAARSFDELTADVRGAGFKKNSRFRVEVASTVPGVNPDRWDWDQVTSFREDQESFTRSLRIPLDASVRGERLMLRLITPEGTVYSRSIRP